MIYSTSESNKFITIGGKVRKAKTNPDDKFAEKDIWNHQQNPNEYTPEECLQFIKTFNLAISDVSTTPEPTINNVPVDNINICFVGGVSTGKSTILNAIFCEELTQCKIKRTTMVPTIYIENENDSPNLDIPEHIFSTISKKNKEIIEKTESGSLTTESDYDELIFNVGKLDINILPDSYVNVYDIPGLNDARTKDIYYKYLEKNFIKFNLLIFIVDIHSGLNTSDENDILTFIVNHTKKQLCDNNKKIYTLVVVNKADDMQLVEDSANDELELTGELSEMMEQVKKTITREFSDNEISNHLVGIIPLCAIDSYLYRMVKKHGNDFKLSPEQILKIGINENGKKFSTLKPATQEAKVKAILNDADFIETMITLSGFGHFEKLLHSFLDNGNTGTCIRVNNLLFELNKLPTILDSIKHFNHQPSLLKEKFEQYFKILNMIKKIDVGIYDDLYITTYSDTETSLVNIIENYAVLTDAINYYDNFKNTILIPYYSEICNYENHYPKYLQEFIVKRIQNTFENEVLTISKILDNIFICSKVNILNKDTINTLLTSIMNNVHNYECLSMQYYNFEQDEELISFVKLATDLGFNMSKFIRFIILVRINIGLFNDTDRIQKQMLYLSFGEIPIYTRLVIVNSKNAHRFEITDFLEGLSSEIINRDCHKLDLFYLENYSK